MEPEPGDELVVEPDDSGRGARVGTILGVSHSDGHATFLVHWVTGDYDALVSPWPGVHVRHREHQAGTSTTGTDALTDPSQSQRDRAAAGGARNAA